MEPLHPVEVPNLETTDWLWGLPGRRQSHGVSNHDVFLTLVLLGLSSLPGRRLSCGGLQSGDGWCHDVPNCGVYHGKGNLTGSPIMISWPIGSDRERAILWRSPIWIGNLHNIAFSLADPTLQTNDTSGHQASPDWTQMPKTLLKDSSPLHLLLFKRTGQFIEFAGFFLPVQLLSKYSTQVAGISFTDDPPLIHSTMVVPCPTLHVGSSVSSTYGMKEPLTPAILQKFTPWVCDS